MAASRNHLDNPVSPLGSPSAGTIPPRQRYTPTRRDTIPPQPSLRRHFIRLGIATGAGIVLMLLLLWLAVQYAQRDWNQKNIRARTAHGPRSAKAGAPPAETVAGPQGWTYELAPAVTQRQLQKLASDRLVSNWWSIQARGLSDKPRPDLPVSSLYMALAAQGEKPEIRNDLGAFFLQQKRMKDAVAQFRAADQIQPGFAPARFNLALGAISDRNPAQAVQLLGQYLGQRPEDMAALRLQAALLSQMGRQRDALRMLEKFLKYQPAQQPLFLEAAMLAARLGESGNALRYLDSAMNGNAIQTVIRAYQSPAFREIRLSGEGDQLAAVMANKARVAFGAPIPTEEIQPLRTTGSEAKFR